MNCKETAHNIIKRCMNEIFELDADILYGKLNDALYCIAQLEERKPANNWISVDDELPENEDVVNVKYGSGLFGYGFYNKETSEWYYDTEDDLAMEHVAYWQPIPPAPEDK